MTETKPKWRAEFHVNINKVEIPTLGDTGCSKTVISETFFREHPYLQSSNFRPLLSYKGEAINGTRVLTLGLVNLQFRIKGTFMHITARIVRGLIRPVILGWDFFSKYSAYLDPASGQLRFMNGKSAPLIENSESISGCYYRVHEDLVIPANSKMHTEVELMLDNNTAKSASQEVTTDPYPWHGGDIWACRSISRVQEGKILTELINTGNQSVKLEAGTVLGYAEFVDEESYGTDMTVETDMLCSYKGDDSAYETGDEDDEEDIEELEMESRPPKGQYYQQKDTPPRRMTQSPKGQRSCRSITPLWRRTLCHMRRN